MSSQTSYQSDSSSEYYSYEPDYSYQSESYEPDYSYQDPEPDPEHGRDYYINTCAVCNDIHICDCNANTDSEYGFFLHIDNDLISIPATPVNKYSMRNKKYKKTKSKPQNPPKRQLNDICSCNIIHLSFGCLYIAILYTCLF